MFDEMVETKDFAGNSFSGTVAQASFLSCLVSCRAWRDIDLKATSLKRGLVESDLDAPGHGKRPKVAAENAFSEKPGGAPTDEAGRLDQPNHPSGVGRDSNRLLVPTKRLRKKTTLRQGQLKRVNRRGYGGKGNHKSTGKSQMATIAEKEAIMRTYTEAVERKDPKPIDKICKMKGYFKGCVYPSKWGKARKQQQWSVFVAAAPRLCAQRRELPDVFRNILKLKKRREFACNREKTELFHLPAPLQAVIDDTVSERILMGEEVQMIFVKNVMQVAISLWNEIVPGLLIQI